MAEPPNPAGPFWLLAGLLLAGAIGGGNGTFLLERLPGVNREQAKTWALRIGLTVSAVVGATVTAIAVRHLLACRQAATAARCVWSAVVVELPAPVAGMPPFDLTVHVDGLTSLFLALVGFCAACIAVYSFGWLRGDPLRDSVAGAFNLFLGATLLTVVVSNVFWLFIALELITLSSVHLVRYRGRSGGSPAASRTAVRTYLLVSHAGLICLLIGLLPVVVQGGVLEFDALQSASPPRFADVSFVLVLLGLSVRAGVTPFHFWVPTVHPQLPTNTHAMMSAVMLKVAVYLMIRFFFEGALGPVRWWWGAALLVLAGATAVVTVFYALLSKDLKTALAYHSVENIGIILAGVGLALLFSDQRLRTVPILRGVGALALLASLYHVVNHALFKTLLFLGTGSIEKQTGTVETQALGGLLRRSPWVGATFLVGAAAIAGFPPLNGFISEWLTVQALFGGRAIYQTEAQVALVAMVVLAVVLIALAMAFALTALAFVKIAGESLLGEPRTRYGVAPVGWSMRAVLALLAGTCLLLGLQPWLLVPWLSTAIAPLGLDASVLHATPTALTVQVALGPVAEGSYRAVLPTLPLLLLGALPLSLTLVMRTAGWVRRPVWVGGEPFEPGRMQYTGNALTGLVWEPLAREHQPGEELRETPLQASLRLSPGRRVVELANWLYDGLVTRTMAISQRLGERLQNGDIRSYLLYIFAVVLLVLVLLAVYR